MALMGLCLYGSCVSIVLPQSYLISYLAFGGTHLFIRGLGKWMKKETERKRLVGIFKD